MPIIEIQWVDSIRSNEGWEESITVSPEDRFLTVTAGYLYKETEYSYVVVQSHSEKNYLFVLEIPKVCVKNISFFDTPERHLTFS